MSDDFVIRRRSFEETRPNPEVFKWWSSIPANKRPVKLARAYPRIVNKIALLWYQPGLCEKYLSNLLLDTSRRNRAGFPLPLAEEILELHSLLTKTRPVQEYFDQVLDVYQNEATRFH